MSGGWCPVYVYDPGKMKQTLTKDIVNNNEKVIRHHFLLENRPTTTLYNISTEKVTILTLWLFNIAMENGPFIDDFPSFKTSIFMVGIFHGELLVITRW